MPPYKTEYYVGSLHSRALMGVCNGDGINSGHSASPVALFISVFRRLSGARQAHIMIATEFGGRGIDWHEAESDWRVTGAMIIVMS